MKLWDEYTAWRESGAKDIASVVPSRYTDMHSIARSSGISDYLEFCDFIENFAGATPKSIILLPFTHCHRIVMSRPPGLSSKLIHVDFDDATGILSSASEEFLKLSSLRFSDWRIRGQVRAGGDFHIIVTGYDLSFVRSGVLSGKRLALEGTGTAQQYYTTGCSRIESAIVSACCARSQDEAYFINLRYGCKL